MAERKGLSETEIHSYLAEISQNQWKLLHPLECGNWHLGYHSTINKRDFNVYLSYSEKWAYFQVPLFESNSSINAESTPALQETLLDLNNETHYCKFSLDGRDKYLLNIEIPSDCFDFINFRNALEAIETHLERYYQGIYQIAHKNSSAQKAPPVSQSLYPKEIIHWITKPTIELYLSKILKKDWKAYGIQTTEEWHLIYRSYRREFNVFINFTEEWVYFQVPLLQSGKSIHPDSQGGVFEYLLKLNNVIHLGKLALGSAKEILLIIELPADSFSFMMFQNAIGALENYLEKYFAEISIIAQQPEFANFVKQGNFSVIKDDFVIEFK